MDKILEAALADFQYSEDLSPKGFRYLVMPVLKIGQRTSTGILPALKSKRDRSNNPLIYLKLEEQCQTPKIPTSLINFAQILATFLINMMRRKLKLILNSVLHTSLTKTRKLTLGVISFSSSGQIRI